jgi:predicted ribosome quality control (RQC) complex YloA/Tae2 family protein
LERTGFMNFDTMLLSAVTDELAQTVLGAKIDKVSQPEPLEVVFGLYKHNSRRNLLISADANSARAHFIKQRGRPNPATAPAFCMLLRKYLEGGMIEESTQPLGFCDRVLRLSIRGLQSDRYELWIEVMGRQSNIILTAKNGMILGAIKRVTAGMSRVREIRAGILYEPPPKQLGYKRDPMLPVSAMGLPEEEFAGEDEAEKWLTATFRGVGSLLAKEARLHRPTGPMTGENLWFGLNEMLNFVRLAEYSPQVYVDDTGHVSGAYPVELRSVPSQNQTKAATISEALEVAYDSVLSLDTLDKERAALVAALRKAHKAAERQALDLSEGLLNSENSESFRETGELLLANIGVGPHGATEIIVDDYFAETSGTKRNISMDPSLTVHQNAERYFRKFQKARDSRESLLERQSSLEKSIAELEHAIEAAIHAVTAQEITVLTEHLATDLGATHQNLPGKRQEASPYDGHKIKTYRSPDGWEILIGENSTSNDFLTTKVASSSDIWLHARAVPSAHAVIRAQNRPASVSNAALMLAAEQVAKRSSAKHARLVSVDYTLKKYVRKPRGSAPGQVTYSNEKTIDVVAEEAE